MKNRYIILLYHSLGERDANDYLKLRIKPESFEEQMAYLAEKKYNVAPLAEVITAGSKPKNIVSITFDDGYLDNLELAIPILKKYAFSAALFITTDYLYGRGRKNNYWGKWQYLTSEMIKEVVSMGFAIGSHSCSHESLASLDDSQIGGEVSSSKKALEDILQDKITLFSYPHGIFNGRVKAILREAGYLAACTSILGFNSNNTDPFELRRIEIRSDDSLDDFKNKLEGRYNWLGYFQKMRLKFQ